VLGERRIAELLRTLGADWTVIHSVPVGRGASDIDHVAIGPPGVFTINTKFSPGKVVWVAGRNMYVGGSAQHHVRNALTEARRASTYLTNSSGLTVPVTGLIVFVDPARISHKAPAGGGDADPPIMVLHDGELLGALSQRREFNDEQVATIVAAAVRPETWSDAATESSKGSHISREFQALELEVGPRLALPRGQARVSATPRHPGYERTRRAPVRRPTSRAGSRRRPKRSRLERVLTELALPIALLVGVWVYLSSR
jgi:hypothetical protein